MIETEINLQTMAANGLFLKERLSQSTNPFYFEENNEQIMKKNYELWQKKAGGNGGKQAFLKRLAAEDLSVERAKSILAPVSWQEDALLPSWVRELEKVLKTLPIRPTTFKEKLHYQVSSNRLAEKMDTTIALFPFLYYAEQQALLKLGNRVDLFSDTALSDMSKVLAKTLNQLVFKTCLFEFQSAIKQQNPLFVLIGDMMSSEERVAKWNDFLEDLLAGKWGQILLDYPVLGRLIISMITNWVENLSEFSHHLMEDKQALAQTFHAGNQLGKLIHIDADVSDLHNKGKSVFILTFSSGIKLVYKPRSLAIDVAWSKWVQYMADNGLPHKLKTPKVVERDNYGWMEFIEYKPLERLEEAAAFYFRSGVLLGIVYAFGGNDFHYENIIASGSQPVLVDTETLLLHKVKPFELDEKGLSAAQKANDVLNDSVLRVGMLPMWRTKQNGEAFDLGGLTGKGEGKLNLPIYEGETLDVTDYQDELINGMKWVFAFVEKRKEELIGKNSIVHDIFGDCLFRFLIRNSQIYGDMLEHTAKPEYLRDGLLYSFEIERMAAAYLLSAPDNSLKALWKIFLSERDALELRDIPIFYGKAKELTLRDSKKTLHTSYFMESAIDNAKKLIKRMDQTDERFQIDLIKASLSMHHGVSHEVKEVSRDNVLHQSEISVTNELLLKEALDIYDELIEKRILVKTDDFTWIVRQFNLQTEKMTLGQIGISLYDGVIGLAVFMAALYRITEKVEIKETAILTLKGFRESLHDTYNPLPLHRLPLGLGSGLAGMIRGLIVIGEYLEDDSFKNDAMTIAKSIQYRQIDQDKQLDRLGGAAGLLTVLIDLYKQTEDDELLTLARYCGQHLLKKRIKAKSGHKMWRIGIEIEPLTGMGHGAAGYASALYQLANITKDESFYEAAFEAVDYENSLYDAQFNNWPDLRKIPFTKNNHEKAFMMGWCSGAPGIGLARINMLEPNETITEQKMIKKDIERAVQFTRSLSDELTDHICCGHTGGIDLLIEAALILNRSDLLTEAREQMGVIINRKRYNEHFLLNGNDHGAIFNPSFFQGISGVGYQLLRCIAPNKIISLLK